MHARTVQSGPGISAYHQLASAHVQERQVKEVVIQIANQLETSNRLQVTSD